MTVLLRLAYDGTDFHGYARQVGPDGLDRVRTVQGELDRGLESLFKTSVTTRAASRTDAGVHADGQLAAFDPPFEIPDRGIVLGLGSHLPQDVVVLAAWQESGVEGGPVDPRHGNEGKHYHYEIRCNPLRDPGRRRRQWHLGRQLDLEAIERAAEGLVGTHDFGAFRAVTCQASTTRRTITRVEIGSKTETLGPADRGRLDHLSPHEGGEMVDVVMIHVFGTAFLKNMVRIMVGSLVEVGLGRRSEESLTEAFGTGRRGDAGMTAPAHGLTLVEVLWPRSGRAPPRVGGG